MVAAKEAPPGRRLITLHQYSDFWCPWCYIGYREINAAIDRCKQEKHTPAMQKNSKLRQCDETDRAYERGLRSLKRRGRSATCCC